jgi:hypothetical protein
MKERKESVRWRKGRELRASGQKTGSPTMIRLVLIGKRLPPQNREEAFSLSIIQTIGKEFIRLLPAW